MSKKTSNAMKAAQQPTPEQLAAEKARVLRQKLMAIAEGIYIQLAGNSAYATDAPEVLEQRAIELAERWMATFYGLVKKKEEKGA